VVIATKSMDVISAAESARSLVGPDTVVVTIQNGLGSADRVADVLGADRVVVGVVGGFGSSIKAPGHAHHHGMEWMGLGEIKTPVTARLKAISHVWSSAGFNVETFDDTDQLVWEKLICNVCFSGTCAITEMTIGQVIACEEAWHVASGCAEEAFQVARAGGTRLTFEDPVKHVHDFGSKIPDARPSLLLDLMAGRASEIDVINGAIPREGIKVNVSTPFNTVVSSLVRAKEHRLGLRRPHGPGSP